jgi:ubiquinone/menaquinone biosynthesis C-methylase UbiE
MSILAKIPELICPQCHGQLEEKERENLHCTVCDKVYPIKNGIPHLLDHGAKALAEEIAVQDRVAIEYQQKRYNNPYSNRYHQWWTKEMLRGLDLTGRILDNGCGVGLLDGFVPKEKLVGFDISSEMLACAADYVPKLVLGNSQVQPFADNSFDLVICRSLLHHLQEPQKAVAEISRILMQGGHVTLADTNTSLLSYLPRIIAKHGEHFSEDHKNMSFSKIRKLLDPYFKITDIRYFGYVAYPLVGFPDLVKVFQSFPFKELSYKLLMGIDELLAHTPLLKTQSWGIIVKAVKKRSSL